MEGHEDAFWDANILHRDISTGNILIAQDQGQFRGKNAPADEPVDTIPAGSELLIDWDLRLEHPCQRSTANKERTGTWQFISSALLAQSHGVNLLPHVMEDDRESSFYVILYLALRYSKRKGGHEILSRLRMFDEFITRTVGLPTGGELKELLIIDRRPYPIEFNPPLDAIIAGAAEFFRPRYDAITEKEKAAYRKIKASGVDDETLNEGTMYGQHLAGLKRMQAKGTWVAFLREKLNEDGWSDKDFHIQKL